MISGNYVSTEVGVSQTDTGRNVFFRNPFRVGYVTRLDSLLNYEKKT